MVGRGLRDRKKERAHSGPLEVLLRARFPVLSFDVDGIEMVEGREHEERGQEERCGPRQPSRRGGGRGHDPACKEEREREAAPVSKSRRGASPLFFFPPSISGALALLLSFPPPTCSRLEKDSPTAPRQTRRSLVESDVIGRKTFLKRATQQRSVGRVPTRSHSRFCCCFLFFFFFSFSFSLSPASPFLSSLSLFFLTPLSLQ